MLVVIYRLLLISKTEIVCLWPGFLSLTRWSPCLILSSDVEHCYCAVILFLLRMSLSDKSGLLPLDLMPFAENFDVHLRPCIALRKEIYWFDFWKFGNDAPKQKCMVASRVSLVPEFLRSAFSVSFLFFFSFLIYNTIIHSSFGQGVKPIGLPKRAFSRTWRLFGGSGEVRHIKSLSLSPSQHFYRI